MTTSERILRAVAVSGPLDDDQLAQRLHVVRQQVNQAARRLAAAGRLSRYIGPDGKLVNAVSEPVGMAALKNPPPLHEAAESRRHPYPSPDLLLVTCVKTKTPTPRAAKDLYISPLFRKQREYAERLGVPWYILSAEHGLVAPTEWLSPYERYLPETSRQYQHAWGAWVGARLELLQGDLRGVVIEVHASADYLSAIRGPLTNRGATIRESLAGLAHGQRLAWYGHPATDASEPTALALRLSDTAAAVSPADLIAGGPTGLKVPGLYSWWVDAAGATELSRGLGHHIEAGLVYAGLAGATRWPSGKRSSNTLWERITGMHLGRKHSFSTLRRTFGSVLASARAWSEIDEEALTEWMHAHLRVVLVPYPDADGLGRAEEAVLAQLDPPLNLRSVTPTDLRRELSSLRSRYTSTSRSAGQ